MAKRACSPRQWCLQSLRAVILLRVGGGASAQGQANISGGFGSPRQQPSIPRGPSALTASLETGVCSRLHLF